MSDGSPTLRFLDPKTFRVTRRLHVSDENGQAVEQLNELEYVHGEIYANVWHSNMIARVSPRTGRVVGWIDLSGIIERRELANGEAVLNGIAYDAAGDRLFVTGKLWPKLFEIRVVARHRGYKAPFKSDDLRGAEAPPFHKSSSLQNRIRDLRGVHGGLHIVGADNVGTFQNEGNLRRKGSVEARFGRGIFAIARQGAANEGFARSPGQ